MRKKVVALYMSLMMALVLIIPTRAEEPGKNQKSDGNVIQVCEIEGLRTKSSETFLLSDGTYDCVVYSENKYFEDGGGNLVPIDNTVVETRYSFNEKDYVIQWLKGAYNLWIFKIKRKTDIVYYLKIKKLLNRITK